MGSAFPRFCNRAVFTALSAFLVIGCEQGGASRDTVNENFAIRVAGYVYSVPLEYRPYAGNLIADDLRDLQRGGVGVAGNPLDAQKIRFRTRGNERTGVGSISIQISARQNFPLTGRQMAKKVDVENIKAIVVRGPIPGDDDPNSIYRMYKLSADFEFADGRAKSVPFDCQGGDGFGEVLGETIFGCHLGLVVDENTGLLLRLGPYEDPELIKNDISFALSCLLALRQVERKCQ